MYQDKHASLLEKLQRGEVGGLTSKLIQFESVNPPGNELEIAHYIAAYLNEARLEVEVLEHAPGRGSVVARIPGRGLLPGLVFSGHLDVVPVEGDWTRYPFSGEEADGRIWGRGSTDMKGGVAAMMVAAKTIAQAGVGLDGDLYLCFTAGEETDNLGAAETVERYPFGEIQAIFISEPSNNEIVTAEKGALWLEITTYGRSAHTSQMDESRNALSMMLPILTELSDINLNVEPHPLLGNFLGSINTLHAGTKTNTIPAQCVATIDYRTLPGQVHSEILGRVEAVVERVSKGAGLPDFRAQVRAVLDNPPLEVPPDDPVLDPLFYIAAEVKGHAQDSPKGVGFFTDAVKFAPALRAPFAVCGPGDPTLNHRSNEWVEIRRLEESVRIYTIAALEYLR